MLEELLALAMEGAYSDLARKLEGLAKEDPALADFAKTLGTMARDFDEDGVEQLLREGLEG